MKKSNLLMNFIVLILLCNFSLAQINIGSKVSGGSYEAGDIEKADLEKLKTTKTLFVYRDIDKPILDDFKKHLKEVWTLTELEFVPFEKFKELRNSDKYSFFTLAGFTSSSDIVSNTHCYLSLWMNHTSKKGEKSKKAFCRIEMYPSFESGKIIGKGSYDPDQPSGFDNNYSYPVFYSDKVIIHNWNLGFVKNYLKMVNDYLIAGKIRWLYDDELDKVEIKNVKINTLYVPDYVLIKMDKKTGDESERFNDKELLAEYPAGHKIISAKELSAKILTSESPIYYLAYVKSSTDKFIVIFNSKTGRIVYSKYRYVSYNPQASDFGDIIKKMK